MNGRLGVRRLGVRQHTVYDLVVACTLFDPLATAVCEMLQNYTFLFAQLKLHRDQKSAYNLPRARANLLMGKRTQDMKDTHLLLAVTFACGFTLSR